MSDFIILRQISLMRLIAREDLRYSRETKYARQIKPKLEHIREVYPEIVNRQYERERNFFHLLSTSIRIDSHPMVKGVMETVRQAYDLDIPVLVFVYQDEFPKAMCSSYAIPSQEGGKELIILVSQHFFNLLDYQERLAILAHEVCHYVLGHLDIPAGVILQEKFSLRDALGIRTPLLKWSLCAELSSDIIALFVNDMRPKVFSNSIIKFSSGISALDSYDLIELLLNQYDEIAQDEQSSQLSLHPILPLRIKVVHEVAKTEFVKRIGQEVSNANFTLFKKEYEKVIDDCISAVYPEITGSALAVSDEVLLDLGLAVGLADHDLEDEEVETIYNAVGIRTPPEEYLSTLGLPDDPSPADYEKVIDFLINKSLKAVKRSDHERHDLMPVLRFLISISASDQDVALEELNVIYRFFKEFDFSRHDIVMTLEQMHLEPYGDHT